MAEQFMNLLTDALFTVALDGAPLTLTLPGILSHLADGGPIEFSALQPHQHHAWHAFTVQLAAIALHASGEEMFAHDEGAWRIMLLCLTENDDAPWCLVVDDLSKPAFMQPPVPERSLSGWTPVASPDEIDILVTARNHDVKLSRIAAPSPEHWVYALVTLQTMAGFDGQKNYGIARMNGGYSNRPCVAATPDLSVVSRFQRDVKVLLATRPSMIETYGYRPNGGNALLWTRQWTGGVSERLSIEECDPFFIEVTRRVRLAVDQSSSIGCYRKGSAAARINADERKGDLGDPWVPTTHDGAALTAKNLSYRTLYRVLFSGDFETNAARRILPEDGDSPTIVAQVLARGQGKTEGYHERYIPVPRSARELFEKPDRHQQLASLARDFVANVDDLEKKVIKPALLILLQGGPDKINFKDDRADPQIGALDDAVDQIFFSRLFELAGGDHGVALTAWRKDIFGLAEQILRDAFDSTPIPIARRYRAIAMAERAFYGAARKFAPEAFKPEEERDGRTGTTTD